MRLTLPTILACAVLAACQTNPTTQASRSVVRSGPPSHMGPMPKLKPATKASASSPTPLTYKGQVRVMPPWPGVPQSSKPLPTSRSTPIQLVRVVPVIDPTTPTPPVAVPASPTAAKSYGPTSAAAPTPPAQKPAPQRVAEGHAPASTSRSTAPKRTVVDRAYESAVPPKEDRPEVGQFQVSVRFRTEGDTDVADFVYSPVLRRLAPQHCFAVLGQANKAISGAAARSEARAEAVAGALRQFGAQKVTARGEPPKDDPTGLERRRAYVYLVDCAYFGFTTAQEEREAAAGIP